MEVNSLGRIGVLMGGPSTEREISLRSGRAVALALRQAGLDAVEIDIETDRQEENARRISSYGVQCAFVALHGRYGEDGQIQQVLEGLRLPYTGSGVDASRQAMDKVSAHQAFLAAGIRIPRYEVRLRTSEGAFAPLGITIPFPVVVKPATHGSSIGLSLVEESALFSEALKTAFSFDEKVLIEEFIAGRELTVGVIDGEALPVVEIRPKKKVFDYQAKYEKGMTEYIVPAPLTAAEQSLVQEAGVRAYRALRCSGAARVDIMLAADGQAYVLEINTIPGMTETSLLPKAARQAGMDFSQLCVRLVALAYEKIKKA
jgi:D-alanine-D-alanine ligase